MPTKRRWDKISPCKIEAKCWLYANRRYPSLSAEMTLDRSPVPKYTETRYITLSFTGSYKIIDFWSRSFDTFPLDSRVIRLSDSRKDYNIKI